jgi:hypothetical protein
MDLGGSFSETETETETETGTAEGVWTWWPWDEGIGNRESGIGKGGRDPPFPKYPIPDSLFLIPKAASAHRDGRALTLLMPLILKVDSVAERVSELAVCMGGTPSLTRRGET